MNGRKYSGNIRVSCLILAVYKYPLRGMGIRLPAAFQSSLRHQCIGKEQWTNLPTRTIAPRVNNYRLLPLAVLNTTKPYNLLEYCTVRDGQTANLTGLLVTL